MLDLGAQVALVLSPSNRQAESIQRSLDLFGFKNIRSFESADEAFEVTSRAQYGLFVVGIDEADCGGLILLQRLRATGNYGFEPFLFLGDKISPSHLAMFLEYEVDYALTSPLTPERIKGKLEFLIQRENHISPELERYRSAKAALHSGILDMAEFHAKYLIENGKIVEKSEILLGDIAFKKNELETAKQIFLKVIAANPLSASAKHRLASVYIEQSLLEDAKALLDDLVQLQPFHLNVLENAGLTNFELGHHDLAMSQLQQLQHLFKANKLAGSLITKINIKQGNYQNITANLMASFGEEEIVTMLNNAGIALAHEKNFEGAVAVYLDCLKVITRDDYRSKLYYNLGLTYQKWGKMDCAKDSLEQALLLNPQMEKASAILNKLKNSA